MDTKKLLDIYVRLPVIYERYMDKYRIGKILFNFRNPDLPIYIPPRLQTKEIKLLQNENTKTSWQNLLSDEEQNYTFSCDNCWLLRKEEYQIEMDERTEKQRRMRQTIWFE